MKLIPAHQTSIIILPPRPLEGRCREAREWRDLVRCPCGTRSQTCRSGRCRAPPGLTTKPCQELADDRKVYSKRGPPISSELCPAAGHLRRKRGRCRITSQAFMLRLSLHDERIWRAERRPPRPATDAEP